MGYSEAAIAGERVEYMLTHWLTNPVVTCFPKSLHKTHTQFSCDQSNEYPVPPAVLISVMHRLVQ